MDRYPNLIVFDGTCMLCNRFVMFLLKKDRKSLFRFSEIKHPDPGAKNRDATACVPPDTVLFFHQGRWYEKSDAVLQILSRLPGAWKMTRALYVFPRFLRDAVYTLVARHRHAWFGHADHCPIPPADWDGRLVSPDPEFPFRTP